MTDEPVAIIGLGLIGSSLGRALRRVGVPVRGHDVSSHIATVSLDAGCIDIASGSLELAVQGAAVVIVATPLLQIPDLIVCIDQLTDDDVLVMDVGSVKWPLVKVMREFRHPSRAIGGHPLAGKERTGPSEADPTLFEQRPFTLSPNEFTSDGTIQRAIALVERIGASPLLISAEDHDRVVATTSHLPQLLSSALALSVDAPHANISGPGLQDMTRLAFSDAAMWREILILNKENVLGAAKDFQARFSRLVTALENEAGDELETLIRQGGKSAALIYAAPL